MKNIIASIFIVGLLTLFWLYLEPLTNFLANYISSNPPLVLKEKSIYAKNEQYLFTQPTNNFVPYSYQDLINIIYSTLNNHWEDFTFYCPKEYVKCLEDIELISGNELILTHINNYVHPFNGFNNINTTISESGEINIHINYLYDEAKIKKINTKVEELILNLITNEMSDYDKIKTIHDYIINNSKYDVERNETEKSQYDSYTAFGPLFQGFATCNGYTDLMAIFLNKLNIRNYKIATTPERITYSSEGHIWNAVFIDNKWLHLDLTWDDPVSNTKEDYLFHTYFLVTTEALKKADSGQAKIEEHNFDPLYYLEFSI
ncbi:MAG: hypothetical protein E7172_02660 [Firmicutes bacterium]|nr:hypothetical protein [Bacillota bacterium]